MSMIFRELDEETRSWMNRRLSVEELSGAAYRSTSLSPSGLRSWPMLMKDAITDPFGTETTLAMSLNRPDFWNATRPAPGSKTGQAKINIRQSSELLALTEFNTWYVAGLAHRLHDEGSTQCVVYRASEPKWSQAGCSSHEGRVVEIQDIIAGHRAGYWPRPGNPNVLSIPAGPGCHHTIARI